MRVKTLVSILVSFLISPQLISAIEEQQCPGPNELYKCGGPCQTDCRTLGQVCPIISKKCIDACYCEDGYARDYKDTCIPIDNCPRHADDTFIQELRKKRLNLKLNPLSALAQMKRSNVAVKPNVQHLEDNSL